ncbi:MAG: arginase family protein [Actinomycetota bacterium]|nr:arginase family protein [Actinomycetota bacterium]
MPAPDLTAVAVLCRTSDTAPGPALGAHALARALGRRLGAQPHALGEPTRELPRRRWEDDLRGARACLDEVGALADEAFAAERPLLVAAGECSVAVTTLAALARERPDARVLWLDAHGDFNSPGTSESGYLGGMCLAGGCGVWDTGFEGAVAPDQVVLAGVRDLDEGERELLADTRAHLLGVTSDLPARVRVAVQDEPVFVHLDLDVLDPDAFPTTQVPTQGGLSEAGLEEVLRGVAESATVLGVEVTAFDAPADSRERERLAERVAALVAPLLQAR